MLEKNSHSLIWTAGAILVGAALILSMLVFGNNFAKQINLYFVSMSDEGELVSQNAQTELPNIDGSSRTGAGDTTSLNSDGSVTVTAGSNASDTFYRFYSDGSYSMGPFKAGHDYLFSGDLKTNMPEVAPRWGYHLAGEPTSWHDSVPTQQIVDAGTGKAVKTVNVPNLVSELDTWRHFQYEIDIPQGTTAFYISLQRLIPSSGSGGTYMTFKNIRVNPIP